jgi:signal transduction histidine kinase
MTAVLGRTIVRPIEALSRATRLLAEGRKAEPPQPTLRVREIDGLIHDFATMAAAIEHRSHYLRDFAAALAHEFKTPLTGLRGGIELLQDHGAAMAEAERTRFLANMAADTERLNRLISRLMELAKAEMRPAMIGVTCDVAEVLARLGDGMSAQGFAVDVTLPPDLPALAIDAPALETVLATLIDNARQAGASAIAITGIQEPGIIRLTLADNGPGIPAGDVARIFEPFFTSKRADGGTGLGLSIARALIEGNHGRLDHRADLPGAVFDITLPTGGSL